jgi:L-threonylcarbamoyladenylate synthase
MKYRHYAPKAAMTLIEGAEDAVVDEINRQVKAAQAEGRKAGVICTDETYHRYSEGMVRSVGVRAQEETIAHNLFSVLREFDDLEVDVIYSESFAKDHLGQAIMNRLMKAAGYRVIHV